MTGKPRRHKLHTVTLGDLIGDPPWIHHKLPTTPEDRQAFLAGVVVGLLDLLSRKAPADEEAAVQAIEIAKDFWSELRPKGIDHAVEATRSIVASLSARDLSRIKRDAKRHPILLLEHYSELVEGLSTCSDRDARRTLLQQRWGLKEEDALSLAGDNDAEAAEEALAIRYRISRSYVHKLLAEAPKKLAAIRKKRTAFPL